jgi:hypothetical protein
MVSSRKPRKIGLITTIRNSSALDEGAAGKSTARQSLAMPEDLLMADETAGDRVEDSVHAWHRDLYSGKSINGEKYRRHRHP